MNKFILPFTVSTLCLMLTACGGGSNNINENPTVKPEDTTAVGCKISSTSASCFPFMLEYPIAGIQYTCSSDTVNTFKTQVDENIVIGGCDKNDTVTFFLNANNNARVELGSVKLSNLGRTSTNVSPVHLTLLDMAEGLTGQAATSLEQNDATVKVALELIKIFQAIGNQKNNSNVIGDVQLITLTSTSLEGLSDITQKVDLTAYQNGQYAAILKPWIDVAQISDTEALAVLKQAIHMTLSAVYQAEPPILAGVMDGMTGYAGSGDNQNTLLGTFFLMSDRQGYTHGYGIQWRGKPTLTSETIASAIDLIRKVNPIFMYASSQQNWISPISDRIATVDKFKFVTSNNESLFINQGRLINDLVAAGSENYYKYITGEQTVPANDLVKWTMNTGSENYAGGVDIIKAYPISYLDRRVFRSSTNINSGEKYYFPLYATLRFKGSNTQTFKDVDLGIVIDEFGDIRTDIKAGATDTDMSGQCGTVDSGQLNLTDNYGVTQYRIGTLTATNYQPDQNDLSTSLRIILAGSHFGTLEGIVLGISGTVLHSEDSTTLPTTTVDTGGAKINLYSLLNNANGNINLTNQSNSTAQWVNIYNYYKAIYAQAAENPILTDKEKDQITHTEGTVSISLASCYARGQVKS
ncbi:hypothetical protein GCM10023206_32850 [Acinetobacter puyangensis]|uniref:Pilus assembly protein FilF n=1 Tax=Acinetobacter puyangensis TaxID=1096779 RepID=A0A240EFR7_9GAMM|nr:protein FilF [Acinetobacter puyangensis]SNX46780.1 hypothetical protein SAMN05421731_1201 [Acinetobacter puyangensis]